MTTLRAPTRLELLKELRTYEEFPKLALSWPTLAVQPRGTGQPVLVLPGFTASDESTRLMRGYLRYLNYDARGWGLGRNTGNFAAFLPRIIRKIQQMHDESGMPVRLVGWSLGGFYAREAGRHVQSLIHHIVTLGSPVIGGPKYTAVARTYEALGYDLSDLEVLLEQRHATPLQSNITAVYTKGDGIVSWRACIDERSPNVEHVEVSGSHLGLGFNPSVLRIIAKRLAN